MPSSELPDLVEIDREIGLKGSLYEFTEMCWPIVEPGQPFIGGWHLGLICEHYEACLRGEIDRLVVNVPPGMTKSRETCVFFPTWDWIRAPHLRFIFASFDQQLTRRDAADSLAFIHTDWFQARWGYILQVPKISPVDIIQTGAKGWRLATSVGGKATGWHGHFQIIDDPIKPRDAAALTGQALEDNKNWLKGTMASRWVKPGINCRILIMQRLHEDDLAAVMKEEGATVVSLPMHYDPQVRCFTKWGQDQRTTEGELLCPQRYDEASVKLIQREMGGMVAAAQLEQSPVPKGGLIFKEENLKQYWKVLPSKISQAVQSWDCTFKKLDDNDYVCGGVWYRCGSDYYLVDRVWRRMTFTETCAAVRALTAKWPKVIAKLIEDKANGSAVIDTLHKEIPGIIEVEPEGGKEARANAISPLFEAGNVWLPDPEMPGYEWVELEYKPELCKFPRGKKDDQVDMTTQALLYLHQKRSYLDEAMTKLRKKT
jgi:predicted phage terminase large subunit-like protein